MWLRQLIFLPVSEKTLARYTWHTNHLPEIVMSDSIETLVKNIVADQLEVKLEDIKIESSFIGDLGADSLDTVELVMALEEAFDLEITDEDAEKLTTVQSVIDHITEKTQ